MSIRTRFAPSPTGYLHIGNARTALFNWAFTRRHGGAFVLRIEDTDAARNTPEAERAIVEGLAWLGIEWDEGPLRQSERADEHRAAVDAMLAAGRAYRCRCSRESLEERKQATIARGGKWTYDGRCRDLALGPDCGEHTVRIRMPETGELSWDDAVFGPSGQDASEIGDRIIARADGSPLYSLAGVVDDLHDRISHVIRGADHHPNTPLQIALYRALDREPPHFAHVPLILAPSGKKLSKRRDRVSVERFREEGYLAEAMRNWLVRTGWSHGDQEIFSREEIAALFDLDHVGRAGARSDPDKLAWLNQHYIGELAGEALFERVQPFLERAVDAPVQASDGVLALIDLNRSRSKTLVELAEKTAWLPRAAVVYDEKAARKQLSPETAPLLAALREGLAGLEVWEADAMEQVFDAVATANGGLAMGRLAQPVRVALTGGTASPGIFETLCVVGRDRSLERLDAAIEKAGAAR